MTLSSKLLFNSTEYTYEYNSCSDGQAVRLMLPNAHWITKYINYSGHLYKSIGSEKIPVECMMDLDEEFRKEHEHLFGYEINFVKRPFQYWQPDYSYGIFSQYGDIQENKKTQIGWFVYIREYDKEEIETSVKNVLETLAAIEKEKIETLAVIEKEKIETLI